MVVRQSVLAVLLFAGVVVGAASEEFNASARGFGNVAVTLRPLGEKKSWTTFATEDAAHATVCASKRLADLLGFGDLKAVADSELPGSVLALKDGPCWLLGLDGDKFQELCAPNLAELKTLAKDCGANAWSPVPAKAYPRWLDCFDNAGPGVWVGGGGDQYTLPSDFEWLRDRKLAMCTLSPSQSRLVGPGVVDTTIYDWHTAMAAKYDIPYRVLAFPKVHEWLWNRKPLPYIVPEAGRSTTAPWLDYQCNASAKAFEPNPSADSYDQDFRRRLAAHLASDPNYVGMHGCDEIPEAGVAILAAVARTPGIKALWHAYLAGELRMSLAAVGQMHQGDPDRYKSWDEVEVPLPIDFLGWNPATCLDLRGAWQMHPDTARQGDKGDWVEGDCNDPMILVYTPQRHKPELQPDFWMRRSIDVPNAKNLRYLHISRDIHHGNHTPLFDVQLNGKKLVCLSDDRGDFDQCFAVGDALHDGKNQIVMNTHGAPVPGYIFLGPEELRRFPHMSKSQNRLWFDATNFDAWLRVGKVEAELRSTRAADPDRPLKLMAMINLLDMTIPLCERYGAYQHDTGGAGGYWAPMTGARLSRAHGLPWSCEQGGPPNSVADMQSAMTFYLMYGNDAVDMVFAVSHYNSKPEVSKWFDQNLELIRCVGKMSLPTPKIGVLRSSRATRFGFHDPWNWDIARGALQAVGRNFEYLEVPDILNGTIDQFPVVIDCGTVLLTDAEIEGIKRYVRRGGVFIAQHHTGRNSPDQGDSWNLAKAWGLTVEPKYMSDDNFNKWPLAKMRFTEDQDLLKSLKGKEIEGSGVAVDYLGKEHGGVVGIVGKGEAIHPVATWDDGSMAIADVHEGRGRFILLGTPFYLRMKDVAGVWVNDARRGAWLDEFLTSLGVPRDSWTGASEVWAELWRSKNGVYDLYPVARMGRTGDGTKNVAVKLRRAEPVAELTEISALGHPKVEVKSADGAVTLPSADYGQLQSRVFAAPRADVERSAFDWFKSQAGIWRALPPIPEERKPIAIPVPEDMLPLPDGWTLKVAGQPDRLVDIGAFGTLGLPENAVATFEKTVAVPEAWKGRRVQLVFDAEHWFWGILPKAKLHVNGKEELSIKPEALPGFSFDVTGPEICVRLEVDGSSAGLKNQNKPGQEKKGQPKPNGVTGLFYLQALAPDVKSEPLPGPWQAATSFNQFVPAKVGDKVKCLYFETSFTLPKAWPAKRVFLDSPSPLGFLCLNGQILRTPMWMKRLDISGMVKADGSENVLRWVPAARNVAAWNRPYEGVLPQMNLAWME